MRLVVPERDYDWGKVKLLAGGKYLMEQRAVGGFLTRLDGKACVEAADISSYSRHKDYNGQTLLIVRAGGIGDILMLTPLLHAMRKEWPEAKLEVACGSRSQFALPDFCEWISYPLEMGEAMKKDGVLDLSDVIEGEFEVHGVQAFGNAAGFPDLPLKLHYEPDPVVVGDIRIRYPKKAKARVGMQMRASSPIRTYPHCNEVLELLLAKGIEVVLFAEPKAVIIETQHPLITNASGDALDMEDSIALASLCDCLIAPDSSFVHFGCAMNVPTIGLYGSFSYAIRRTHGHPDNYFIEARGDCSPCNHHGHGGEAWPSHGPCKQSGLCNVLAGIPAERVARKAIQICKA